MFDQLEVEGEGETDGVDVGPVWDHRDDRESMTRHGQLSSLKTPDSAPALTSLLRYHPACARVPIQEYQIKVHHHRLVSQPRA